MTTIDTGASLRDGKPFSTGGGNTIAGTPATEPDSMTRHLQKTGKYFDPARAQRYRSTRTTLAPDFDYGPLTALVADVQSIRNRLKDTESARTKLSARAVIDAADQLDIEERIEATRAGRPHQAGKHGAAARAAVDEADMAAAIALRDAEEVDARLTKALGEHAIELRERNDVATQADIDEANNLLARLGALVRRIQHRESLTGAHERTFIAPTIDPALTIDARPAGIEGWRPPPGSLHGMAVRNLLSAGRDHPFPRGMELILDTDVSRSKLGQWLDERPLSALWQPDS